MPIDSQEGLQQFGDLAPALVAAGDDDGLAGGPVDRTQTVPARGLGRRGDHPLLADWTPHGPQGRMPTDVEFVGIVEDLPGLQTIASRLDRLFLIAYSGSGLVI